MDAACALRCRTVASPLGPIEVSACERGLHGIRLLGRGTPDARWVTPSDACCGGAGPVCGAPAAGRRVPGLASVYPLDLCSPFSGSHRFPGTPFPVPGGVSQAAVGRHFSSITEI